MENFSRLGLSKEITDVVKRLGFKKPSEIQEKTIPLGLKGKDVIGGSSTGSGKTFAFSAPILEKLKSNGEIQCLILTPTRELAEQVANSIKIFSKNKGLNVLAVYGGIKIDTQIRKMPGTDILVGTPGRVLDLMNRNFLRLNNIKFLVLDEVDRMFDMGFYKDVERILKECPQDRQTFLFSATISHDIDHLVKKYTKDAVEISVESKVDPSKLKQVYYDVPDKRKFSLLVTLLKHENADLVMVFCSTRRNVDFVSRNLKLNGLDAKAIHGGLDQKKRLRILEEFHKKGLGVLVCTDVAARGLHIDGVSHVYNYDVPDDTKDYVHRIGRTARAGKEGKAITILASRDYEKFSNVLNRENVKLDPKDVPQLVKIKIKIEESRGRPGGRPGRFGNRNGGQRGRSQGSRRDGGRSHGRRNSGRRNNNSNRGPRKRY